MSAASGNIFWVYMCIFICLCVGMNIVFTIWVNSIYHLSIVFTMACNAGEPGLIPGLGDHLEKEMATPSSILAWEIPWTEKPGRLQSMGLHRVGQDWAVNSLTFMSIVNWIQYSAVNWILYYPMQWIIYFLPRSQWEKSLNLLKSELLVFNFYKV